MNVFIVSMQIRGTECKIKSILYEIRNILMQNSKRFNAKFESFECKTRDI